eukprot:6604119-Ditylum_brightwellii.AAC.1
MPCTVRLEYLQTLRIMYPNQQTHCCQQLHGNALCVHLHNFCNVLSQHVCRNGIAVLEAEVISFIVDMLHLCACDPNAKIGRWRGCVLQRRDPLVSHGLFLGYYYAGVGAMMEPWNASPVRPEEEEAALKV